MMLTLYRDTVLFTANCNVKLMAGVPTLIEMTAGLLTFRAI